MWSVIRYHHLLRSGLSWKINKNIVELWHNSLSDTDSLTSTLSFGIDENDNRSVNPANDVRQKTDWLDFVISDSDMEDKVDEKMLGEGSGEDDSLLVIFQDWQ